jgi:hypothetical protein
MCFTYSITGFKIYKCISEFQKDASVYIKKKKKKNNQNVYSVEQNDFHLVIFVLPL